MKLNKNKVYDLSELTDEELNNVWEYLTKNDEDWEDCKFEEMIENREGYYLCFRDDNWTWEKGIEPTVNAKELFYTLDNVQVDCRELTEEQIKEMASVFENNGYKQWIDPDALKIIDNYTYLTIAWKNEFYITGDLNTKTTITYDKFMELFNVKEHKSGWYTLKGSKSFLMYHNFEKGIKFGFDALGEWLYDDDSMDRWYTDNLIKASDKEAELRLIKEAVSRGFKKGATFNYKGSDVYCVEDNIYLEYNVLYYGHFPIMNNGVWAGIVEQETKPSQYNIGIDTFDRCEANMTKEEILSCVRFNLDKYTWRLKGQDKEDFEKIIAYAKWGLKQLNK